MMYRTIAMVVPGKIRRNTAQLLTYANINIDADKFVGFVFSFSILLSLAIGFNLGVIFKLSFLPLFIASLILTIVFVYLWLILTADNKGKFIEDVLPDALQLMSSNLRAGLTTDRSLLLSARPEFGPLQDEINLVGKEITVGKDIGDALMGITQRVKSTKLARTIELIVSGIKSGGELASLLSETAEDLRNQQLVQKKIRSSVNMYIIFIFVAAGIASPVLFGLSSYLAEVITTTIGEVSLPDVSTTNIPVHFTSISISIPFIIKFSIASLITTAFLGSFILGLISQGKEKEGVKFILPLVLLSVSLFFVSRYLIKSMLTGLFGI